MEVYNFFVEKDESIINSIKVLDKMAKKIVLVVEEGKLIGVVTDGDIRRWILKNGSLEEKVSCIMNHHPIYIKEGERHLAREIFLHKQIEAIPILDDKKKVIDIIFFNDEMKHKVKHSNDLVDIPVVIMAGGKGTRLYPYTKVLPKPLIPIGNQTILEHIMERFTNFGCNKFYLTVNYKKNMIKAYLEEKREEVKISFVEEEKFLGTGGSLYLLKDKLDKTFILSNCDILVDVDYGNLIRYHKENRCKITMVTSLKNYTIPYGVIRVSNEGSISEMIEKPEYNFQVNTGLYICEPEILKKIPENEFYHMTELINQYVKKGEKVGVYPITGNSWLDMGELNEMEIMINKLKAEQE